LTTAVVGEYELVVAGAHVVGVDVVDGEVVDGLVGGLVDVDVIDEEGNTGFVEEVVSWLDVFGVDPVAFACDPDGVMVGGGDGRWR
jgi:hypothetical protein